MPTAEHDGRVDRDCARWNLTPFETQKRRALFWELFITDCWQVGSFTEEGLSFEAIINTLPFPRVLLRAGYPHFRFPSSTVNSLKTWSNSWLTTVPPKLLVSIPGCIIRFYNAPLLSQFHIGRLNLESNVFLKLLRAFSLLAHPSTLSSSTLIARFVTWNFLNMHSIPRLRVRPSPS